MQQHPIKIVKDCYLLMLKELPFPTIIEGVSYLGSAIVAGLMPLSWKILFESIYETYKNKDIKLIFIPILIFFVFQLLEVVFRLLGRLPTRVMGYAENIVKVLQKKLYLHTI